jgi:hypothetical protein
MTAWGANSDLYKEQLLKYYSYETLGLYITISRSAGNECPGHVYVGSIHGE